ncbi:hypothetical protein KI387_009770, partial [Taxus chinensis]
CLMMERYHHHPCCDAKTQEEEGKISSLVEETKMPFRDAPQLLYSQSAHSQVAPRWTQTEMLVLVREKWIVENEIIHSTSKIQNDGVVSNMWKLVSTRCKSSKVERTADQCRKKWESLLSDCKKIKDWEFQFQAQSYWNMSHNAKKQHKIPSYMERQLFDAMDAYLSKVPIRSSQDTFDSLDTEANGLIAIEHDFQDDILEVQVPTHS